MCDGAVLNWYTKLPGLSINSWQDLKREVIKNFTTMESQEMSYGEMSIMQ